jgi:streptomycin 6-kinase
LKCDEERGFLLLERLKPGQMLSELDNDDERTQIAADVMQRIWRAIPAAGESGLSNKFIKLSDWFDGLKKIRPHFNGGTGPFPKEILERAESLLPELFSDKNVKLMHGDFHHFNILSSERGWLVIDPKGVIGPVGYEIGPLMLNPWNSISDRVSFQVRAERRMSILSERLGWEREKIINWTTAHAVLSAWWDFQDGMDWQYSMNCAKIFSGIK